MSEQPEPYCDRASPLTEEEMQWTAQHIEAKTPYHAMCSEVLLMVIDHYAATRPQSWLDDRLQWHQFVLNQALESWRGARNVLEHFGDATDGMEPADKKQLRKELSAYQRERDAYLRSAPGILEAQRIIMTSKRTDTKRYKAALVRRDDGLERLWKRWASTAPRAHKRSPE